MGFHSHGLFCGRYAREGGEGCREEACLTPRKQMGPSLPSKLECPYPLCDRYPCFCMAVGPRPGSAGRAGPRRWRRSPCLCHFSEVVDGQISASHLRLRSSTRGLSCSLTYVKPLTQHGRPSWFSQNTPDRYGWVWDIQTISEWIRLLCAITEHKKAAKCAMCSPQFLHFLPSI